MAKRHVSPNRMEWMRLRRELQIARRGHRMLKDKRDGLMKTFMERIEETQMLRLRVDRLLAAALGDMRFARAVMQPEHLDYALRGTAGEELRVDVSSENIMAVRVPRFHVPEGILERGAHEALPYGMADTAAEMDDAVSALRRIFPYILRLAEQEKTVQMLADEIERTRRRVNSLEHVMIPDLEASIREIRLKMDENERGNLTRLMKVKDMLVAEEIRKRRYEDGDYEAGERYAGA